MFKNQFLWLASLCLLMLFTCVTYAEIHPISAWDLQVEISGSGADTVWMLAGFTFIDYNIPIEDIVFGRSEGGVSAGQNIANIDNPDLYKMTDRANCNPPYIRTTQFGGQSLWNDGNGNKYDFFIFESSNPGETENFTVQAILEDGTLGQGMGVVRGDWDPAKLQPPEPSLRDGLGLVRTSAPQSGKSPWGIAFKVTDLKDAGGNPLTNLTRIQGIQINSAGADFCLICAAKSGGPPVALNPTPVVGSIKTSSKVTLSWDAGNRMVSQKVYLSTNLSDVASGADAALIAPQHAKTSLEVQVEGGKTYYWRVDTVDDEGTLKPGSVWNFQTVPNTASQPRPYDGAKFVSIVPTLNWTPGLDAQRFTVVVGTDQAAVASATEGIEVTEPSYTPGAALANETMHYWRVDTFDGTTTHTGTVWRFTTTRETGGLLGRYYDGEFGPLIETRIDPEINFFWDVGDPNHPIAGSYSVRWQGELEAPIDGLYTFTLTSSDWARLYVDGILVVNDWNSHSTRDVSGAIELSAGFHSIAVDFYKDPGETFIEIRLWWESDLFAREIVPFGALIPKPKAIAVWPHNEAVDVAQSVRLQWIGTDRQAKYPVYLGPSPDALSALGKVEGDTSFLVKGLETGILYYWRIDEVLSGQTTEGRVWQFTTAADWVIDDAENYTGLEGQTVFDTWADGYGGNGSGSMVGFLDFPFVEEDIVHGGRQSLPLVYDNTGKFVDSKGQHSGATYSEISRSVQPQNWSGQKTLQLWYHGASQQNFSYDAKAQTYTIQGVGTGPGGKQDNVTYIYGQLTGDGAIVARIEGPGGNQAFPVQARLGVMMRKSLDPDAKSVMMTLGGNGAVSRIWRSEVGLDNEVLGVQTAAWLPHYVRIIRKAGVFRTTYGPDGINWAEETEHSVSMDLTVYIGLVVSSGSAYEAIEVTFADVQVTGNVVPQPFAEFKVLGLAGIAPEPLYVKVKDTAGGKATVVHPDADAILTTTWKAWHISLSDMAGQGLNLGAIDTLTIGVGKPAVIGGTGTVFLDDIRLLTK